jgi:signal peptidase II
MEHSHGDRSETVDGGQQTAEEVVELRSRKVLLPPAWWRAVCLFLAVALVGLTADLLTKHWAFQSLGFLDGSVYWVWQGVFGFQTTLNPGALFGIFAGKTALLVGLSLIFLTGIVAWLALWAWRNLFLTVILGMITAGICGNLYDRLGLHGLVYPEWYPPGMAGQQAYAVRDWILCMIGTFHWPNFNIADALLVCSVILLLLHGMLFEEKENSSETSGNSPQESMIA